MDLPACARRCRCAADPARHAETVRRLRWPGHGRLHRHTAQGRLLDARNVGLDDRASGIRWRHSARDRSVHAAGGIAGFDLHAGSRPFPPRCRWLLLDLTRQRISIAVRGSGADAGDPWRRPLLCRRPDEERKSNSTAGTARIGRCRLSLQNQNQIGLVKCQPTREGSNNDVRLFPMRAVQSRHAYRSGARSWIAAAGIVCTGAATEGRRRPRTRRGHLVDIAWRLHAR